MLLIKSRSTQFIIDNFIVGFKKMSEKQNDSPPILRYSGSSKIPGGKYFSDIQISGRAKIEENLECQRFDCSGWCTCKETLIVHKTAHVSGRFKNKGDVLVDGDASLSGFTTIKGNLVVGGTLINTGILRVDGDVRGTRINLGGIPRIRGRLYYVNDFKLSGIARLACEPVRINSAELLAEVPTISSSEESYEVIEIVDSRPRCCPYCGEELSEGETFCAACGNSFD